MRNLSTFVVTLLLAAASASGAPIIPGASLSIDGIDQSSFLNLPSVQNGYNVFTMSSPVIIPRMAKVASLGWYSFDDPFINYFLAVQNINDTAHTFSFTFSNPYTGGPYTILNDSFTDSFTDGNGDGVVSIGLPPGSTNIAQPFVDGVNRDGQGVACTQTGFPGFSGSCNTGPSLMAFPIPATNASGTFGVTVNFVLDPGVIYTFNGHADLFNPVSVPEPATWTAMASGLCLIVLAAGRRGSGFNSVK